MPLRPGERLGRYEIVGLLALGGRPTAAVTPGSDARWPSRSFPRGWSRPILAPPRFEIEARAASVLNHAVAERSMGLVMLKADRAWDRIRDDPRFTAIVRRVGIP